MKVIELHKLSWRLTMEAITDETIITTHELYHNGVSMMISHGRHATIKGNKTIDRAFITSNGEFDTLDEALADQGYQLKRVTH